MTPHKHHDFYSGRIGKKKGTTENSTAHSIVHLRNIISSCICCFVWKYLSSPPALLTYLAESKIDLTIERSDIVPYIPIAYCYSIPAPRHLSRDLRPRPKGNRQDTQGQGRMNERTVSFRNLSRAPVLDFAVRLPVYASASPSSSGHTKRKPEERL